MTSWLERTWKYPFAPSNLVINIDFHILNAAEYPFGMACCRLWCSLLDSVQSPSHIFCLTGFIAATLSATSSVMTITTIWIFRMLAANLSLPWSILYTTWLASSRRDSLNCAALLCLPQSKWKPSSPGMPEVNVDSLVFVHFLLNTCPFFFLDAIVDESLCSVCR